MVLGNRFETIEGTVDVQSTREILKPVINDEYPKAFLIALYTEYLQMLNKYGYPLLM